ncbi:MAG: DNA-directed RNA polymerase subunit delta [Bacilli bacterium]|nr:DNA-directed RNA polymerase subunit delta [Bacilli bacterium]
MKKNKSMRDCAFDELTTASRSLPFAELYALVANDLEMTEEEKAAHIGALYTDLTLDGRFVTLDGNVWDLRSRHTYDKVHISVADIYEQAEADQADVDPEDNEGDELAEQAGENGEEGEGGEEEEETERGAASLESFGINE